MKVYCPAYTRVALKQPFTMITRLAFCLLACLVLGGFPQQAQASPATNPTRATSQDSTSARRATQALATLKMHTELSKQQEEYIHNMFLGKYQYLEQHEASGPRWELLVETNKRKLREWLGEEAYTRLEKAGLIEEWFESTQEQ